MPTKKKKKPLEPRLKAARKSLQRVHPIGSVRYHGRFVNFGAGTVIGHDVRVDGAIVIRRTIIRWHNPPWYWYQIRGDVPGEMETTEIQPTKPVFRVGSSILSRDGTVLVDHPQDDNEDW